MRDSKSSPEVLWRGTKTLQETIYALVRNKQTSSADFKALVSFYGKTKIRELYEREKKLIEEGKK